MDFAYVPDQILLNIIRRLPLHDQVNMACLSKRLRYISIVAISETNRIDLTDCPCYVKPRNLENLLGLCAGNLRSASIRPWNQSSLFRFVEPDEFCFLHLSFHSQSREHFYPIELVQEDEFALIFAQFSYPMLETLNLGHATLGNALFAQIVQKSPNLRRLTWLGRHDGVVPTLYSGICVDSLRSLRLDQCEISLLLSMIEKCPNLTDLRFGFRRLPRRSTIDHMFGYCGKVETLTMNLMEWPIRHRLPASLEANDFTKFWALRSLRSLALLVPVEDDLVAKISAHFKQLHSLSMRPSVRLTSVSFTSLASLPELRRLVVGNLSTDHDYLDRDCNLGICHLAHCGRLEEVDLICGPKVSSATFLRLIQFCPMLHRLRVEAPKDIRSPAEAAAVVQSLVGRERDLEIHFGVTSAYEAWNSDEVKNALREVNRVNACSIRVIAYADWSTAVGVENGSDVNAVAEK